ncbi:deoxyribodipyrimidine photo-lyase, partial [Persicitalea sp.]|uniref:cryptochrome/photolyase family protein n=1 Tax=Persicitalea sp. TaxID=3100273 RepID=UPI003593F2C8
MTQPTMSKKKIAIFWHRRDMRLHDNAGLYRALNSDFPVLPLFVFDKTILDQLEDKRDRRLEFIMRAVEEMKEKLEKEDSALLVKYGVPLKVWQEIVEEYDVAEVYTNHDYEPYAKERDGEVEDFLEKKDIPFHTFKDQVIFEKEEILTQKGTPYTVFTPYSRSWKEKLHGSKEKLFYVKPYPTEKYFNNLFKTKKLPVPSLEDMGFERMPDEEFPPKKVRDEKLEKYAETRNYPAVPGTSRLSIHLRFGTISIRELAQQGMEESETFLGELIWRDFYQQILWNFPHVGEGKAFRPEYDRIKWRNNEEEFQKWCDGMTGYPIVDAGMRQLNATGYMHNRLRMITASFLIKDLLIDWRW